MAPKTTTTTANTVTAPDHWSSPVSNFVPSLVSRIKNVDELLESEKAKSLYRVLNGRVGVDRYKFMSSCFQISNWRELREKDYCDKISRDLGLKRIELKNENIILNHGSVTILTDGQGRVLSFSSNVGRCLYGHNANIETDPKRVAEAFGIAAKIVNSFLSIAAPAMQRRVFPGDLLADMARFTYAEVAVQIADPRMELIRAASVARCKHLNAPKLNHEKRGVSWSWTDGGLAFYEKVAEVVDKGVFDCAMAPQTRIELKLKGAALQEAMGLDSGRPKTVQLDYAASALSNVLAKTIGVFSFGGEYKEPKRSVKWYHQLQHAKCCVRNELGDELSTAIAGWKGSLGSEHGLTRAECNALFARIDKYRAAEGELSIELLKGEPERLVLYPKGVARKMDCRAGESLKEVVQFHLPAPIKL